MLSVCTERDRRAHEEDDVKTHRKRTAMYLLSRNARTPEATGGKDATTSFRGRMTLLTFSGKRFHNCDVTNFYYLKQKCQSREKPLSFSKVQMDYRSKYKILNYRTLTDTRDK